MTKLYKNISFIILLTTYRCAVPFSFVIGFFEEVLVIEETIADELKSIIYDCKVRVWGLYNIHLI
ncbi:hypothetical protein [Thalassobellus citreus]|uniref:hypothetical protein n=1 Tax=Thalassobellus citreus TaxID=3367752 RepID=UPI0037A82241